MHATEQTKPKRLLEIPSKRKLIRKANEGDKSILGLTFRLIKEPTVSIHWCSVDYSPTKLLQPLTCKINSYRQDINICLHYDVLLRQLRTLNRCLVLEVLIFLKGEIYTTPVP